jgi:pilus assembly protein CpaC
LSVAPPALLSMCLATGGIKGMRKSAFIVGVALALLPAPALAQGYRSSADTGLHAGQLDVPLNKSQVLTLDRPYGKAMVGNAEVADILPITNRSLYVLGKKMGTTSLTVYDNNNNVISVVDVAVGPDIVSLRRQLSELIPGEKIGARISNDAVVLTGVVSNGPAIDRAVQLAKTYAGEKIVNMMSVGASQQVMLEVRFSEINRQSGKQIGFSGFTGSDGGSFGSATGNGAGLVPDPTTGQGVLRLDSITGSFGVFRKAFNAFGLNINATLDALERKGLVKTLAEPTLVALSGETASFLAGGEFPVPVAQGNNGGGGGGGAGGGSITVEFKPFGVSLAFTPTVLADGIINLQVEPEVSSIDPTASITVNGLVVPGLQTRRANTVLELRDGESFALAGLIRRDFQTTVRQVPLLGSIPIIGTLFRSSGFQKGETELVIVVTPRLVQPIKADQVRLPTDRVQNPNEGELFLMGRTDKAVGINPVDPDAPPPEAAAKPAGATDYDY